MILWDAVDCVTPVGLDGCAQRWPLTGIHDNGYQPQQNSNDLVEQFNNKHSTINQYTTYKNIVLLKSLMVFCANNCYFYRVYRQR